jgi:hypothetical protein
MRPLAILALAAFGASAEPIPNILWGKWTIKRILPTTSISCWDDKQARVLIGTELEYASDFFRWKTTITKNPQVETRTIMAEEFHNENSGRGRLSSHVTFAQIGIKEPKVVQIEIKHNPAEITGGTTEIPGDLVVVKNPNTIVLSACGVFFEATRITNRK